LHLQTGEFLTYERVESEFPTPADVEKVAARYGSVLDGIEKPGNSLESRVRWQHQVGRALLQADGGHIMVAFLFRGGQLLATIKLEPDDQQDKYVLMEHLADEVVTRGADEVNVSSEIWMADAPNDEALAWVRPADRSDRIEGLATYGVNREGQAFTVVTQFDRADGRIVLGEIEEMDNIYLNALLPIRRAWSG
jgi:hypothetical protein